MSLPPELLHDIVDITISACLDDISGWWWKYTEDSAATRLIQGRLLLDIDIPEIPSNNPISALLSTSSQVRAISLRILSDLLEIALDETGIGSLQKSPWTPIHDAEIIMKGMVLVTSAQHIWSETDAILQLPRSLQRYLNMFILELQFAAYYCNYTADPNNVRLSPLHESTQPKLCAEIAGNFNVMNSTPGMLYVQARYSRFTIAYFYHDLNVLAHRLRGSENIVEFYYRAIAHTGPQEHDADLHKRQEEFITNRTQILCSQYSRLDQSINAAHAVNYDLTKLGAVELQKVMEVLQELREDEIHTPEYDVVPRRIAFLETVLSELGTT